MCWEKGWMNSTNRKKHQRRLNRYIRKVNKRISDDIFGDRFYIHQKEAYWTKYEDNSGGKLFVVLELVDKKYNKTLTFADGDNHLCHWGGTELFLKMNNWIIESDFWDDYRNKKLENS